MAAKKPVAATVVPKDGAPLVDATTPSLYRDTTFRQFNYPDPDERARAIKEYELQQVLEQISQMPDVWEEDV